MDYTLEARAVVSRAIDALNESLAPGQRLEKDPSVPLLGDGGALDSMGFVDLAVCIQELVLDTHGWPITVADEAMLSGENPFRTIGSLTEHLAKLLGHADRS